MLLARYCYCKKEIDPVMSTTTSPFGVLSYTTPEQRQAEREEQHRIAQAASREAFQRDQAYIRALNGPPRVPQPELASAAVINLSRGDELAATDASHSRVLACKHLAWLRRAMNDFTETNVTRPEPNNLGFARLRSHHGIMQQHRAQKIAGPSTDCSRGGCVEPRNFPSYRRKEKCSRRAFSP
jgi:hypothetical protein